MVRDFVSQWKQLGNPGLERFMLSLDYIVEPNWQWFRMACLSRIRQGIRILDFGQSSNGYSLVVNTSGVRIRSSSGFESPANARFSYRFGRSLYV